MPYDPNKGPDACYGVDDGGSCFVCGYSIDEGCRCLRCEDCGANIEEDDEAQDYEVYGWLCLTCAEKRGLDKEPSKWRIALWLLLVVLYIASALLVAYLFSDHYAR